MNILKKGNCIELIKELSDNSIDLLECVSILLNRYQEDNANNAYNIERR